MCCGEDFCRYSEHAPGAFYNLGVSKSAAPAAAIILTTVLSRSEVKYGVKAYPYSLIEAGHIAQNILLVCSNSNIGSCPIGGFVNDTISGILDLTKEELPIYVISVGNIKINYDN